MGVADRSCYTAHKTKQVYWGRPCKDDTGTVQGREQRGPLGKEHSRQKWELAQSPDVAVCLAGHVPRKKSICWKGMSQK